VISSHTRQGLTVEQHDYTIKLPNDPKLPRIVSSHLPFPISAKLIYLSLGYSSSPATDYLAPSALKITRPRKQDRRQKKVTRSVFLCYVLGATGSGKTSLLRSFVNKGFTGPKRNSMVSIIEEKDGIAGSAAGGYEPTTKVLSVVNSVEMEGVEKYLVVRLPLLRFRGLLGD
jgi:hypothetical protein